MAAPAFFISWPLWAQLLFAAGVAFVWLNIWAALLGRGHQRQAERFVRSTLGNNSPILGGDNQTGSNVVISIQEQAKTLRELERVRRRKQQELADGLLGAMQNMYFTHDYIDFEGLRAAIRKGEEFDASPCTVCGGHRYRKALEGHK